MFNINIRNALKTAPKGSVAFDIGSSSVKLLEIENAAGPAVLKHIGLKKIPNPSKEALVDTIRSLAEECRVCSKDVNIAVSGPSTIVRFVSMSKMKDDELKNAVKFEAEKYIPFPIDDCILDYQVLKKDDRENKAELLLVAVKKGVVMEKISVVEESGFSVNLIDADTFACANAYSRNCAKSDADKTAAVLDIGASVTNVSVLAQGILRFSRDIAIGGSDFTSAISKGLNVDAAAAEKMKISPSGSPQNAGGAMKNTMNNLVDEVRLSLSYYENQSGAGVDGIHICGGGAILTGLADAFEEGLGAKPSAWDPLGFIDMSGVPEESRVPKEMHRFFAVAAGLVLR
jgi:type IV pilus assembly protein PilM